MCLNSKAKEEYLIINAKMFYHETETLNLSYKVKTNYRLIEYDNGDIKFINNNEDYYTYEPMKTVFDKTKSGYEVIISRYTTKENNIIYIAKIKFPEYVVFKTNFKNSDIYWEYICVPYE